MCLEFDVLMVLACIYVSLCTNFEFELFNTIPHGMQKNSVPNEYYM
jgi:hypothetical protein